MENTIIQNFTYFEGMTSISALISAIESGKNDRKIIEILFDKSKISSKRRELNFLKFKAKQLDFVNVLSEERRNVTAQNIIETQVIEDETASTRSDGNNVNMEKESIELYKSYAQYSMLLTKVKSEFDKFGYVLNSSIK
jgi:flagellar basal-body rod protein FlgB